MGLSLLCNFPFQRTPRNLRLNALFQEGLTKEQKGNSMAFNREKNDEQFNRRHSRCMHFAGHGHSDCYVGFYRPSFGGLIIIPFNLRDARAPLLTGAVLALN
jgi:hypothetical protein